VLHVCGARVPDDLDGKVRLDFFEPDAEPAARAVEYNHVDAHVTGEVDEFDDEAIKEQLRGLGYMN